MWRLGAVLLVKNWEPFASGAAVDTWIHVCEALPIWCLIRLPSILCECRRRHRSSFFSDRPIPIAEAGLYGGQQCVTHA